MQPSSPSHLSVVSTPLEGGITLCGPEAERRLSIEIRPFDLIHGSPSGWSRYHEFWKDLTKEFYPEQPPMDMNTWKRMLLADLGEIDMVAYEAVDLQQNERIAGFFRLWFSKESSPSYRGNEHICNLAGISVRSEYRRRGIATKLLPAVYDETKGHGRRSVTGSILNEAGRILVGKIGGKEALEMQDNRLHLDDVDWNMVSQWVEEGLKRSPGTRIEFFRSIPDEMLEQYCDVFTEVSNQAPRDELRVGDQIVTPESWRARMEKYAEAGMKYLAALTIEENGVISGLTDVAWYPSQPSFLMQSFTGVQEKHRGRGLGKWLKGAMLLRVRDEFPSVITVSTQNATSNDPMLHINRQLGFKLYREIYVFQMELRKLKKYLGR